MDQQWRKQCPEKHMPIPPFDRYIHVLPSCVVRSSLTPGEVGYGAYQPEFSTLEMRDESEILAMELLREYTDIPPPKVIHRGFGLVADDNVILRISVFERLQAVTVNSRATWEKVSPRQREALRLQVRDYIQQLTKIPHSGVVQSLVASGEIFHHQLPDCGSFNSTETFLQAYANEKIPAIHNIAADSLPVFSHMDWDLSNIILHPNFDAVVGVIDWKRACFFAKGGRAIHQMCIQQQGWETLFDGLGFPSRKSPRTPIQPRQIRLEKEE